MKLAPVLLLKQHELLRENIQNNNGFLLDFYLYGLAYAPWLHQRLDLIRVTLHGNDKVSPFRLVYGIGELIDTQELNAWIVGEPYIEGLTSCILFTFLFFSSLMNLLDSRNLVLLSIL